MESGTGHAGSIVENSNAVDTLVTKDLGVREVAGLLPKAKSVYSKDEHAKWENAVVPLVEALEAAG